MRYRLDLSYDGTAFCGWQIQPDAPSVQGSIEDALLKLLRTPTPVTGAGRTDTGVSASAYVAHFDSEVPVDCNSLKFKLNAILPRAIAVQGVSQVAEDFHARFDARKRSYTYYLHRVKDPFEDAHSWWYGFPDVDFDLMNEAARCLLGTHDFSCFEKAGGDNRTSDCTVYEACWKQSPKGQDYWQFHITADRFLRNMVRAVVGTLLEVGRGKRTPESVAAMLLPPSGYNDAAPKTSRRSLAGESVPGHALFLSGIEY